MLIDPKIMKLEDMAESARAIVEEGKDDDEFSSNSIDSGRQSRVQQLKKLTIPEKKKLRAAKMKAFQEEFLRLCK
jgi:hypothetical protein